MDESREFPKYFNYDYSANRYYRVWMPSHDHYTYSYETNSWYEDIIEDEIINDGEEINNNGDDC